MAAEKPRPEKVAVVTEVRERLSSASASLLTEYRGLNVRDLANLRRAVREAGGDYKIYKNTLVRLAVQDLELTELESLLTGPTAVAFVEGDAVMVAKSLRDFARTNPNLVIKGGILGRSVLSAADAGALADVAPREVLLAQFAGALQAPMQKFAGLLAALPRNFAYGLKALLDKRGGPPADEPPADAETEAPAADVTEAPAADVTEAPADAAAEAPADGAAETPPATDVTEAPADATAEVPPATDEPADATSEAPPATDVTEAPADAATDGAAEAPPAADAATDAPAEAPTATDTTDSAPSDENESKE